MHYLREAKFYYDVTNRVYQPGYGLLNAEVGYDIGDHWRVSIYGQNLTNKDYIQAQASNTFGDPGQLGPPRLYGAKFGFRL